MNKLSHILLVDDDEIANYLHKMLIKDMDISYDVEVANDGEEALDIVVEKYALESVQGEILILMDINMPGMDAFDFMEKFHETYKGTLDNVHIVLLTNSVSIRDRNKAGKYEIDGYLDKPLTELKLLELIKQIRTKKIIT